MDFTKLLDDKKAELESLRVKLSKFEYELKKGIKERFPPRWSGDVKELNKFVMDLEEWIKSPKVKRTKELIEILKKYANDKRSFKGLGEDYLTSILDPLENGVTFLSEVGDKSLKANASVKILDKLQGEEEFNELIQDIRNYWQSFKEFEKKETQNGFLKAVKEDMLISLTKPEDFFLEWITNAEDTMKKASNAFELLNDSGVSIQAYIKTYETSKSVDKIWGEADSIRRLLGNTNFQIAGKIEKPFGEISSILSRRNQCIKGKNLTEIDDCLKEIEGIIEDWKRKIGKKFDDEYHKTKALAEFAKLEEGVEEVLEEFRKKIEEECFNVNDIYNLYKRLQEIKSNATKKLERQFSENERKIIENFGNADELVTTMGEDFWVSLKTLREKQLIKIVIERGV